MHESYMRRAIDLANLGLGAVSPNPLVGCVIVHDNQIIGEGYHQKYGEPHAEVNAIHSVKNLEKLSESIVYVTLEPCSHFGKTPPCADLLVYHQVKKVVIALLDPNPNVNGKGIAKLQNAGIEVITGILAKEAQFQNRRFLTNIQKKRPYIILKQAETADGFLARQDFDSKWISDDFSRKLVHKWRTEEDAILVGRNTALHDNPKLTARNWKGRNPTRIVLDRYLKLSPDLHLFDGSVPTVCYNFQKNEVRPNLEFVKLESENFPENILHDLSTRKIGSLLVEGGSEVLQHFLASGVWDEYRIFRSEVSFGNGIIAPRPAGKLIAEEKLQSDNLLIFSNY